LTKSKEKNEIVSYKNTHHFFSFQILENVVVETYLLNRICNSFSSVIQEY